MTAEFARPAESLLRPLRVAAFIITAVILVGLNGPFLVALRDVLTAWELALYSVFAAIVAVDGVLLLTRRSWGAARWFAAALALATSGVLTAALPATELAGTAHRTLGLVGWMGVLLFADRSLGALVSFLAGHGVMSLVQFLLATSGDLGSLPQLALVMVGTAGFQLPVGIAFLALRQVADAATSAAREHAAIRTAEAVADQVHADRERRYAALRSSTVPLLRGMVDGTIDPAGTATRRRCAIEAARMRRLFAEIVDRPDLLAGELAALVDVAERRGTEVGLSVQGSWPEPPEGIRQVVLEEVAAVLLVAVSSARVTVSATDRGVSVSVVSDGPVAETGHRERSGVTVRTVSAVKQVWLEARWPSASS